MTFHVTAEDGRDVSWSSTNDMYLSLDSRPSLVKYEHIYYEQFENLDSGNYHITAKDENNCFIYYDQDRSHT